jgi:uncharacterized protein
MDYRLTGMVVTGGLFYILGQYIASQPLRVEQEAAAEREITVQGTGEVTATPDVASISLGVTTGPQASADVATALLSKTFEAVVADVQRLGVKEEDITTTNLSVQPVYDFGEGERTLRGYEAFESIRIKVRDLDTTGDIVASASREGVNQVGGISFDIDDPDELQRRAEAAAIADARDNAEQLAEALEVRLGRVKTFTSSDTPAPPVFARAALESVGGDAAGPPVPQGSQDVTATITITYELR